MNTEVATKPEKGESEDEKTRRRQSEGSRHERGTEQAPAHTSTREQKTKGAAKDD